MTATLNNPSTAALIEAGSPEHSQMKISKAIYWIEGLFCGNCAAALEYKIAAVKMVDSVSVNFTYSYMIIDYIGDVTALDIIEKTVENLGYKVTNASLDVRQQQLVQQKNKPIVHYFLLLFFPCGRC